MKCRPVATPEGYWNKTAVVEAGQRHNWRPVHDQTFWRKHNFVSPERLEDMWPAVSCV